MTYTGNREKRSVRSAEANSVIASFRHKREGFLFQAGCTGCAHWENIWFGFYRANEDRFQWQVGWNRATSSFSDELYRFAEKGICDYVTIPMELR